jgi:hypothetical protein
LKDRFHIFVKAGKCFEIDESLVPLLLEQITNSYLRFLFVICIALDFPGTAFKDNYPSKSFWGNNSHLSTSFRAHGFFLHY